MGRLKKTAVWLLWVCLWLGGSVASVQAQPDPQPIDAYWQVIATLRQTVEENPSVDGTALRPLLDPSIDQLVNQNSYVLENGRIVIINSQMLLQTLTAPQPSRAQILRETGALLNARTRWEMSAGTDSDLQSLSRILSNPQFNYETVENPLSTWLRDLRLRFNEWLRGFLPDTIPGGQWLSVFVNVVGVIGFLALVIYFLRNLLFGFTREASLNRLLDEEANLTADSALAKAQEFSSGGDYRTAVRYLYLSALLLLEERGLIRYDRSQTNREYLRSVAHRPDLARVLRDVIDVFDRVWYGFQPLGREEYETYVAQVETLKQQKGASS